MSTEEDPELRDLIARCLENNGVLGKLRAQLRASTFLALDQQDDPKVAFPISNSAVQKFASSKQGAITMSLMRELLNFFNMQFSLAVFDPESCESVTYQSINRVDLISKLQLENVDPEEPLLSALITKLLKENKSILVPDSEIDNQLSSLPGSPKEKTGNPKVNGDDYDEDFQSSSSGSVSTSKNDIKEASVEEELDESTSDLLASQSSNLENDTVDKSTSNSTISVADHVETL